MSTVVRTKADYHIYGYEAKIHSSCRQKKTGATVPRFLKNSQENLRRYCPAPTAVVLPSVSGRFNSRVNSVPAGRIAERCLLSQ